MEYYETDRLRYEIVVTDGKLKMSYEYLKKGTFDISVNFGDPKEIAVRVYLPQKQYSVLNAKSTSGNVRVPDSFAGAGTCTVTTASGDISIHVK